MPMVLIPVSEMPMVLIPVSEMPMVLIPIFILSEFSASSIWPIHF